MALPVPSWRGSAEDHFFRSQVIQWLLHHAPPARQPQERAGASAIPRVLLQYWHDLKALPSDVEECLNSWQPLEQDGFDRRIFDDPGARAFIAENYAPRHVAAFDRCYHPAMRCDYFRLCYLLKHGGFYVDADEVYQGVGCESLFQDNRIKIQPICYDTMTRKMVAPEKFLHDTEYPSSRVFYVDNDPIVAPPGHRLLRLALRRSTRILLQRSDKPEIQSTTGPGNFSASLVRHVIQLQKTRSEWDFTMLREWRHISVCPWSLSYRNDERNWRLLNAAAARSGKEV